jgi:electron transfer flavoprotein-quinone oxidoreductase
MDGDQVVGVRCDRQGGEVYADVVILADGVNHAGPQGRLPRRDPGRNVALAVKEILFMPQETIEQRFNIKDEEGVVIEMFGKITDGMMGTGFLYTNKDSLTDRRRLHALRLQGRTPTAPRPTPCWR